MPRVLSVVFRKEEIPLAKPPLKGAVAVVLDILRASSTITAALEHGASKMHLAATPAQARRLAAALPRKSTLLGGERGGLKIDGFDLGNSPRDYSARRVRGMTIVFTTTNGTAAAQGCAAARAKHILFGSLLNLTAAARAAAGFQRDVVLVCAGTEGTAGLDDLYAAGAFAEALCKLRPWSLDDSAEIARRVFLQAGKGGALRIFKASLGGRNLIRAGLGSDLKDCTGSVRYSVVPLYTPRAGVVKALHD